MEKAACLEERIEYLKPYFVKDPSARVLGKLIQLLYPGLGSSYGVVRPNMTIEELSNRTCLGIATKLQDINYEGCFDRVSSYKVYQGVKYALFGFCKSVDAKLHYCGLVDEEVVDDLRISPGKLVPSISSIDNLRKANLARNQKLIEPDESKLILALTEEGMPADEIANIVSEEFGYQRNFKTIRRHYQVQTKKNFPNLKQVDWNREVRDGDSFVPLIEYTYSLYNRKKSRGERGVYNSIVRVLNSRRDKFGFPLVTFKVDAVRVAIKKYQDKNYGVDDLLAA